MFLKFNVSGLKIRWTWVRCLLLTYISTYLCKITTQLSNRSLRLMSKNASWWPVSTLFFPKKKKLYFDFLFIYMFNDIFIVSFYLNDLVTLHRNGNWSCPEANLCSTFKSASGSNRQAIRKSLASVTCNLGFFVVVFATKYLWSDVKFSLMLISMALKRNLFNVWVGTSGCSFFRLSICLSVRRFLKCNKTLFLPRYQSGDGIKRAK